MPPPLIDPEAHGTLPSFMQPYESANHSEQRQEPHRYMRHDSPMETRKPTVQHQPSSVPEHGSSRSVISLPTWELSHQSAAAQEDPRRPISFTMTDTPAHSNNNTDDEAGAADAFQFVTIDHPKKLRDKTQMRANRQFVMHNYLRKEARKVQGSRDVRVAGVKRQRLDSGVSERPAVTRNTSAPSYIFDSSHLTPASSAHSTTSSLGDSDGESGGPIAPTSGPRLQLPQRPNSTSDVLDWTSYEIGQDQDFVLHDFDEHNLPRGQPLSTGFVADQRISDGGLAQRETQGALVPPDDTLEGQATPEITVSEYANIRRHSANVESGQEVSSNTRMQGSAAASVPFSSFSTDWAAPPAAQSNSTALIVRSSSSPTHNAYLAYSTTFIPEPGRARMNTFNTWPRFTSPRLTVERLKYECNKHFGSRAMGANWVPAITSAPHAFLSTICIYGAYDESFHGNSGVGVRRNNAEESILIENEVIGMIQRCIESPVHQTSDATLIAVLHLLNSLVMTRGQKTLRNQALGLTKIVVMRGGLERLGVEGEMATIITSTVMLIAVLGEVAPPEMYGRYLRARDLRPSSSGEKWWPESPVFCGSAFMTGRGSMQEMLHAVKELAQCLRLSRVNGGERDKMQQIAARIAAFEPAAGEVAKHEAVRITARLFANAVVARRPLSEVAAAMNGISPVIQIANALKRTNLDDCWGSDAGVLFWITLVAGAAASENVPEDGTEVPMTEQERARRWLAAVAVRCEILLAFEHANAVLGTLSRMAEIQRLLARGSEPSTGRVTSTAVRSLGGQVQGAFGPARAPRWA